MQRTLQNSCSGMITSYVATTRATRTCTPVSCTCSSSVCKDEICILGTIAPSIPSGMIGYTSYSSGGCPTGNVSSISAIVPGCSPTSASTSILAQCVNGDYTRKSFNSSTTCGGIGNVITPVANLCDGRSAVSNCPTTTTITTTSPASSGSTVWGGNYQINSGGCNTATCCCLSGSFTVTQSGTQLYAPNVPVSGQCGGTTSTTLVATLATPTSTSFSTPSGDLTFTKNGDIVTLTNNAAPQCSGTATCTSGNCRTSTNSPTSTVCFHESTLITYKDQTYSLTDFNNNNIASECRIPHMVRSRDGVIIETSCSKKNSGSLHLTADHLVFTSRGLKPAGDIALGDLLFADLDQRQACEVTRIEHSKEEQTYFGLNCLESIVLANGIKTSTFGQYHVIPATWMSWAGRALGADRASRYGDAVVEFLARIKVL